MSYCINPACPQPQNSANAAQCQACGSRLLLRSRYQVIQPLGQGGFGATFLAKDISLPGQPTCVVKQLRPSANSPRIFEMARELFQREAKTLGKLGDHPQVPRLLDYFEASQQFYLVQEYIRGSTLKHEVKVSGPFNETEVREFLADILPLLQYVHNQGVIHRDIKPANIIRRSQDGHLVLIDFGAVKDQVSQTMLLDPSDQSAYTKFSVGTFSFAPPEQMALRPVYASDIYALAMTCLFLLTGKSPKELDYDAASGEILWRSHIQVSDQLAKILEKMLEPLVGRRYQSASEVLRALNNESDDELLSSSMASQYKRQAQVPEDPTVFNADGSALMTPASRMAQDIRARQARLAKTGFTQQQSDSTRFDSSKTGLNRPPTSKDPMPTTLQNGRSSGGKTAKVPAKWTPDSVRNSYFKGNRDFADCELSGLNLQKANLSGANFYEARLTKTNLQGSDLSAANLGHARLIQANLRDANLAEAYCSTANFEGADLRGANLTGAYLSRANLRGANLCGANLTNATVSDEQLAMAKTNLLTVRPDGKRGFGF